MKQTQLKSFMAATLLAGVQVFNAEDVQINGINYRLRAEDLTAQVIRTPDAAGEIVLPQTVNYGGKAYALTSISDSAFARCEDLETVTIPESVTSIGKRSFSECYILTSVKIPSSVTCIGYAVFWECHSLKDVYLVAMKRNLIKVYGEAYSMTMFKEYMSGNFGKRV